MRVLKHWLLFLSMILSVFGFIFAVCTVYSNVVYIKYINSAK